MTGMSQCRKSGDKCPVWNMRHDFYARHGGSLNGVAGKKQCVHTADFQLAQNAGAARVAHGYARPTPRLVAPDKSAFKLACKVSAKSSDARAVKRFLLP